MVKIEEGHEYDLQHFGDVGGGETILFYKLGADGKMEHDGTTNEEVLKMLIDRMHFLQNAFPCQENAVAIMRLEECLMWLNKRTEDRVSRGVEGTHQK